MSTCKAEQQDRRSVFLLCGFALFILGGISIGAIANRIPSDSQTLLGVIVGGIMLFIRECLQAIRAFWQEQRVGKMTDQLANSPASGAPQDVNVVNAPSDPVPVDAKP